jgi:hypothetical protein
LPDWRKLWRWYAKLDLWPSCRCGSCHSADCCTCCAYYGDTADTADEQRAVTVSERFERILQGGKP